MRDDLQHNFRKTRSIIICLKLQKEQNRMENSFTFWKWTEHKSWTIIEEHFINNAFLYFDAKTEKEARCSSVIFKCSRNKWLQLKISIGRWRQEFATEILTTWPIAASSGRRSHRRAEDPRLSLSLIYNRFVGILQYIKAFRQDAKGSLLYLIKTRWLGKIRLCFITVVTPAPLQLTRTQF